MCLLESDPILLVIGDERKKHNAIRVKEEVANAGGTPQGNRVPLQDQVVVNDLVWSIPRHDGWKGKGNPKPSLQKS